LLTAFSNSTSAIYLGVKDSWLIKVEFNLTFVENERVLFTEALTDVYLLEVSECPALGSWCVPIKTNGYSIKKAAGINSMNQAKKKERANLT
jgi:hypothetical protein